MDYVNKFEELKECLLKYNREAYSEAYFVACFLSGLSDELRAAILRSNPTTLGQAVEFGKSQFIKFEGITKKKNGACKPYNQSWTTSHPKVFEEKEVTCLHHLIALENDPSPDIPIDGVEAIINTLKGDDNITEDRFKRICGDQNLQVWVDTGSIVNFVKEITAHSLGCHIEATSVLLNKVADSQRLVNSLQAKKFGLKMLGHELNDSFHHPWYKIMNTKTRKKIEEIFVVTTQKPTHEENQVLNMLISEIEKNVKEPLDSWEILDSCIGGLKKIFHRPYMRLDEESLVETRNICLGMRATLNCIPTYHSCPNFTLPQALFCYPPPCLAMESYLDTNLGKVKLKIHAGWLITQQLKTNLQVVENWMKIYIDNSRTKKSFAVKDYVYLKLPSYWRNLWPLCKSLTPSSSYYDLSKNLENVSQVAYQMRLLAGSKIYTVFHIFLVKKWVNDKILSPLQEELKLNSNGDSELATMAIVKNGTTQTVQILVKWGAEKVNLVSWEDLFKALGVIQSFTSAYYAFRLTISQTSYCHFPPHLSIGPYVDVIPDEGKDIIQQQKMTVHHLKVNLTIAQSRRKTYADNSRSRGYFEVGDQSPPAQKNTHTSPLHLARGYRQSNTAQEVIAVVGGENRAAKVSWLVEKTLRANVVVLFRKVVFAAKGDSGVNHLKKKAELELYLTLSIELKIGSSIDVSSVKSAMNGIVFYLEAREVEAPFAKTMAVDSPSEDKRIVKKKSPNLDPWGQGSENGGGNVVNLDEKEGEGDPAEGDDEMAEEEAELAKVSFLGHGSLESELRKNWEVEASFDSSCGFANGSDGGNSYLALG